MSWLNLLIIAAWGMLAAQFVIQACLALVLFVFALIGFLAGADRVPRSNNIAAMAASLGGVVAFTLLFFVGLWFVDYTRARWRGPMALADRGLNRFLGLLSLLGPLHLAPTSHEAQKRLARCYARERDAQKGF